MPSALHYSVEGEAGQVEKRSQFDIVGMLIYIYCCSSG